MLFEKKKYGRISLVECFCSINLFTFAEHLYFVCNMYESQG